MKRNKLLAIALIVIMLMMTFATAVFATTSDEVGSKWYAKGKKYGMTSADKVKIERFLSENPVTDAEADAILAKADEAIAIVEESGVTDLSKLTTAQKNQLKEIAKSAAEIVNVTLVFKTSSVEIYKNGKLIETVTANNGKLAYTGNNLNMILVVSTISIIALAITVAAKRTNAK